MRNEYNNRSHLREVEYEEETRRSPIAFIAMGLLVVAIIIVCLLAYIHKRTTYTSWEFVTSVEDSVQADYIRSNKGYIRYNRDGAAEYTAAGEVLWQISYNVSQPIISSRGDYCVVADRGSQKAYYTDGTGDNYSITVPGRIMRTAISENGIIAFMTDSDEQDHIYIYNYEGQMLVDIETTVKKAGFPITMDLSPDGHKLITSYLKVAEEQETWLTFYNLGEVGQNYSDKIVGTFSFYGKLIPDIRFINNDNVCAFTDTTCTMYKFKEVPEEIKTISFEAGITGITSNSSQVAIASYDENNNRAISVYNTSGKLVRIINCNLEHDIFVLEDDELLLTSGATCVIYKNNGKEKMRMRMDESVKLMIPSGTSKTVYTVIENGKVATIRLKSASEETE